MRKINYKKYSQALFEAGMENNFLDNLLADLFSVSEKLDENIDLKTFLADPHIEIGKKEQALQEIFKDFISSHTYNFILLLIKEKKLAYLKQILDHAEKIKLQKEQIVEVIIESAVMVPEKSQQRIGIMVEEKTKKKAVVKNIINENLIGGMRLTIDSDAVFDTSILSKLIQLKDKINQIK